MAGRLMHELKAQGTFEPESEARVRSVINAHTNSVVGRLAVADVCAYLSFCDREEVLGHISELVKKFVEEACLKRNLSPEAAKKAGGKIYTFGSYRTGVHGPGSDIDTLVVAPKHVERSDFNEIFLRMLEQDPIVSEVAVSVYIHCCYCIRCCRRGVKMRD